MIGHTDCLPSEKEIDRVLPAIFTPFDWHDTTAEAPGKLSFDRSREIQLKVRYLLDACEKGRTGSLKQFALVICPHHMRMSQPLRILVQHGRLYDVVN